MSIVTGLFLRLGKVIPASRMTPELAGELHRNLAKLMIYVEGKGVKLTKQQSDYIINQTKQLDLYEKGITPSTTKGPKATVTDITEKLKSTDPYSKKNPGGWMPDEAEEAAIQSRAGRPETGFSQNLVDDTINLLKDKDQKSMSDELKKLMLREGTYADYNDTERKAILDGIQKILETRGGYLDYATGGRAGYANGSGPKSYDVPTESPLKISGNFSKSKGSEILDYVASLEIPVSEKIKLIGELTGVNSSFEDEYGKYKYHDLMKSIGVNYNEGGEGLSAALKHNLDTGGNDAYIQYKMPFATGGRVGYAFGTGKKGVQGILDLVKSKFGKGSITTADKVARPKSALTRDMFKDFNERMKQKDIKKQINETYERLKKEEPGIMAEYDEMWDGEGPVKMSMEDIIDFRSIKPAGKGRFTKAEAIRARLESTIKSVKPGDEDYEYVTGTFPKLIDELETNPSYADNENVWSNLMSDLPGNQRFKIYDDGTVDFQTLKPTHQFKLKDDITKHATGGRVGFSAGGIDKARRAFLKILGGGAAAGVAVKSGVGSLLKGNKAKEAAQVVKAVGNDQPPAYIFDLAKIIRAKGKDITKEAQTIERETVKTYKGMDLYESPDGSFRIQADIPTKFGDQAKQVELMYAKTDEVVDAGMETQKTVKGEIYEEATVSPDIDGKMKDVDMYIDERDHAVLEEFVDKEKKKFKSGGLAYMLGE